MSARIAIPPEALLRYQRAGWRITEHDRPDSGTSSGPCARCRKPTARYGPAGKPLCGDCEAAA